MSTLSMPRVRLRALLAGLIFAMTGAGLRAGTLTLDFEDIPLDGQGAGSLSLYDSGGYTLVSTGGFSARGPGSGSAASAPETSPGSGVVSTSLAANPASTILLFRDDGLAFNLESIDLARDARFHSPDAGRAYPVVTFTGTRADGSIVTQAFTADLPEFAFSTFTFSADFTDLLTVSWDQPPAADGTPTTPAPGLHQFDNITLSTVPEPTSLALLASSLTVLGLAASRRRTSPDRRLK